MTLDENWFTEIHAGTAFSLRIRSKLHEEQSAFQKIEVYDTEAFGRMMVIDGCIMLTDRENFIYHEMMAHPVLFAHPAPKRVAIIGGGDCGTLREVLKHDCVEQVTQVDIDERVTRVAEQFFPQLCAANGDPRARILFDDGIAFIANAEPGSFDVIIIDSTDPVGPAEGLFALPFYRNCLRALARDGILVQQSESPLLHAETILKPLHNDLRQAGFLDVLTLHFPLASYPSGWWTASLAAKDSAISFYREEEAEEIPFATLYYNAAVQRAAAATPEFFRRLLLE